MMGYGVGAATVAMNTSSIADILRPGLQQAYQQQLANQYQSYLVQIPQSQPLQVTGTVTATGAVTPPAQKAIPQEPVDWRKRTLILDES